MCMCDAEPLEGQTTKWPRARKEHHCIECGDVIPVGVQYQLITGVSDHRGWTFKTCEVCVAVRQLYVDTLLPGDCWPAFGQLYEDACQDGRTVDAWKTDAMEHVAA